MSDVEFDGEKFTVRITGDFHRIEKAADGRFIIGGYASVILEEDGREVGDSQGDSVDLDALDDAFKKLMKRESRRNLMAWHSNIQIGELIWDYTDSEGVFWKSQVIRVPTVQYEKKGLFILAELFDDYEESKRYRNAMIKDSMLSFSIGGEALRRKTVCDSNGKCVERIVSMELYEVSSCQKGANKEAKARVMKGTFSHPLLSEAETGGELLRLLRR